MYINYIASKFHTKIQFGFYGIELYLDLEASDGTAGRKYFFLLKAY